MFKTTTFAKLLKVGGIFLRNRWSGKIFFRACSSEVLFAVSSSSSVFEDVGWCITAVAIVLRVTWPKVSGRQALLIFLMFFLDFPQKREEDFSKLLLEISVKFWKLREDWWISMVVLVERFNKKLLWKRLRKQLKQHFNKLTLGCHPTIPIFPQNVKKSLSSSYALMRPINDKEAIIPINRLFSQWSEVTTKGLWIWRNFIFQEVKPNWTKLMKMVYTKEK